MILNKQNILNEKIKQIAINCYAETYEFDLDGFSGNLEKFINSFSKRLIMECSNNLKLNGYDDAANQLVKYFEFKS